MPSRKHTREEIIGKVRDVQIVLAQGGTSAEACRRNMVVLRDQACRMKELKENLRRARLKSALAVRPMPPRYARRMDKISVAKCECPWHARFCR